MKITNPMTELGALKRPQVWFALLIGIVGFGGMFAFYTYISTALTSVSGVPEAFVPFALMLFGLGMVAGNILGGALADRGVVRAIFICLVAIMVVLIAFALLAANPWAALILTFFIGLTGVALTPALQIRLMDVAEDAQTLAAALNHSALNVANASGAWMGGLVIAAGYGYRAPSLLGAGLALAGLAVLGLACSMPADPLSQGARRLARRDHNRDDDQRERHPRRGEAPLRTQPGPDPVAAGDQLGPRADAGDAGLRRSGGRGVGPDPRRRLVPQPQRVVGQGARGGGDPVAQPTGQGASAVSAAASSTTPGATSKPISDL